MKPSKQRLLFQEDFLSHKGGRWDLLAGTAPAIDVQEGDPIAHHAGISVGTNPLQHSGGGPVVEGQLPSAVAAQADPHGPQQHRHARHGPLSGGCHSDIMIGLGLQQPDVARSQSGDSEKHFGAFHDCFPVK